MEHEFEEQNVGDINPVIESYSNDNEPYEPSEPNSPPPPPPPPPPPLSPLPSLPRSRETTPTTIAKNQKETNFNITKLTSLLHRLKVIALIKKGEKVCIHGENFQIDNANQYFWPWQQSVYRLMFRESRLSTLEMIETNIEELFQFLDLAVRQQEQILLNTFSMDPDSSMKEKRPFKIRPGSLVINTIQFALRRERLIQSLQYKQLVKRAQEVLQECKNGLDNLSETYTNDSSVRARIQILINRIEDGNLQIQTSIDYLTKHLGTHDDLANTNG